MRFARVLRSDLKRAILSRRFALGVGLGVLMLYQPAYPFGFFDGIRFQGSTLIDAIQDTSGLGAFILCCAVLCALPYGDVHALEMEGGAFPYITHRTGTRAYLQSKLLSTAISGGAVLCAAFLTFCLIQAFALSPEFPSPADWALVGSTMLELMCYGACWSLCSLALSVWLPNPFVALAAPFCITQFLWLFSAMTDWAYIDPSSTIDRMSSTAPMPLVHLLLQHLGYSFIFILIFMSGVKRKRCG